MGTRLVLVLLAAVAGCGAIPVVSEDYTKQGLEVVPFPSQKSPFHHEAKEAHLVVARADRPVPGSPAPANSTDAAPADEPSGKKTTTGPNPAVVGHLEQGGNGTDLAPLPNASAPAKPPKPSKRSTVECGPVLSNVETAYEPDRHAPRLDPNGESDYRYELSAYVRDATPSEIASVLKHYPMLDDADEDECREMILKEHCALHNELEGSLPFPDSAVSLPPETESLCDLRALEGVVSRRANYREFTRCSIQGMVDEVNVTQYCGLSPSPASLGAGTPLAFAILVHKHPDRVGRLLRAIHRPHHSYVVHVDAERLTAEEVGLAIRKTLCKATKGHCSLPANVRVISRVAVSWGTISVYDALRESARELLRLGSDWTHLINLSESDFPITPVDRVAEFLGEFGQGVNFLDIHNPALALGDKRWRAREAAVHCHGHSFSLHLLLPPPPVPFYDGSMWTIMTRQFWFDVIDGPAAALEQRARQFASRLLIPDEAMQQSLVMNTASCTQVCNVNFRLENWQGHSSPDPFVPEDVPRLMGSLAFFARKFDSDDVLDLVEKELLRQTQERPK